MSYYQGWRLFLLKAKPVLYVVILNNYIFLKNIKIQQTKSSGVTHKI